MIYQFRCRSHGMFEVKQSLLAEHKAGCPECGASGQRVYPMLQWIWAGEAFRPDGSKREDKDYSVLKG